MFKWLRSIFGGQTQVVGKSSTAIQVGRNCKITNSFNGRSIRTDKSLDIIDDEVWVDGKKISKDRV